MKAYSHWGADYMNMTLYAPTSSVVCSCVVIDTLTRLKC